MQYSKACRTHWKTLRCGSSCLKQVDSRLLMKLQSRQRLYKVGHATAQQSVGHYQVHAWSSCVSAI